MALRFVEGFEAHAYQTYLENKWGWYSTSTYGGFTDGRLFGRSAYSWSTSTLYAETPDLGQHATWIIGCAFNASRPATTDLIAIRDSGVGSQLVVSVRKTTVPLGWYLDVKRGATTLATAGPYLDGTWFYIEFKAIVATDATGSFELRVDGVSVASGSGIVTSGLGTPDASGARFEIRCGTNSYNVYLDDIYVCDDTGATENDFLGDQVVEAMFPDGNGDVTAWDGFLNAVPSAQHDTLVDDSAELQSLGDVDVSYIRTDAIGARDLWQHQSLSHITGAIHGIMVSTILRNELAGTTTVGVICRDAADNENVLTTHSVTWSGGYQARHYIASLDPQTGAPWSVSRLADMQFGVKLIA